MAGLVFGALVSLCVSCLQLFLRLSACAIVLVLRGITALFGFALRESGNANQDMP